jgi:peroxiredoxin Q/BCP
VASSPGDKLTGDFGNQPAATSIGDRGLFSIPARNLSLSSLGLLQQYLPKASPAGAEPGLEAGAKAPAFRLQREDGNTVSLKDFKNRNLVLYFYPKADTPGCTKEAIDFSRLRAAFAKAGTDILGVSADPLAAQTKFKTKHKLTIALASDESKAMLQAYGAWGEKSMYGLKFLGVMRKTFLIDGQGRIAQVWPKVRVPGHAEAVLEAARAL